MSRPNILMVVVDSLRTDVAYGDRVATPNLDALARRGTVFSQCICTTTTTTPSFSSMLTGCYPPKHGIRGLQGYRLSSSVTTMADALRDAGYATHAEVTGPLLPETGVLRGFHDPRHRPGYKVQPFGWRDEVVARIRSYDAPWFLLLHVWEVHRPYRCPPDWKKRLDRAGYECAVATTDEHLGPVFEAAGDDAVVIVTGDHGEEYAESDLERRVNRLAQVGRRKLRLSKWAPAIDMRLASRAIGHGFALWEHLIRVPLIVAGPRVPTGRVDDQVRHIDLFPTIADVTGVETPDNVDGRSLRPLMEDGSLPEQPAFVEAVGVKLEGRRLQAARTPDWKLLKRAVGKPALYRLDGDPPDERKNLYNRYPEVVRRLEEYIASVERSAPAVEAGMTRDEEDLVEKHLRDLGYL